VSGRLRNHPAKAIHGGVSGTKNQRTNTAMKAIANLAKILWSAGRDARVCASA